MEGEDKNDEKNAIKPEAILKIAMDNYFHQDKLLWAQIQTLIALQAATLGGAYAVRGTWHVALVIGLGALLLLIVTLFCTRVTDSRDCNWSMVHHLIEKFGSDQLREVMRDQKYQPENLLRICEPISSDSKILDSCPSLPRVRGRVLLAAVVALFALADAYALVAFPHMSHTWPT